jgi:hypothetical protein
LGIRVTRDGVLRHVEAFHASFDPEELLHGGTVKEDRT